MWGAVLCSLWHVLPFPAPVENFLFYPNISILNRHFSIHTVGCSNITHLPAGKTLFCFDSHSWCFSFWKKNPKTRQLTQDKTWGSHGKETKLECSLPGEVFLLFFFPSRAGSSLHKGSSWAASANVSLKLKYLIFFLKTKALPTVLSLWENHSWQLSSVAACCSSGACWFL